MWSSIALFYICMKKMIIAALEEAEKLVLDDGKSYKEMCEIINKNYKSFKKGNKNEKL
ncbi:hypothetical protein [Clostridium perfringens]|uniref:hypothetical protein n=1 Tax=Clostridium perfringens TaxID=1502 RepID=UPI002E7972F4|nr:hypothetical protein [Clostridium perfringens]WVH95245.1 hypothetical protein V0I27_10645 [Clostridium perfringens]BDA26703.1 hypothetical protein CPBEC2_29320 [Clostridium perfringens]HCG3020610.1 hypothetical protein [Clostridium perfringens]HCG3168412.1 hypothetical protein [Clostridium perfringens]